MEKNMLHFQDMAIGTIYKSCGYINLKVSENGAYFISNHNGKLLFYMPCTYFTYEVISTTNIK